MIAACELVRRFGRIGVTGGAEWSRVGSGNVFVRAPERSLMPAGENAGGVWRVFEPEDARLPASLAAELGLPRPLGYALWRRGVREASAAARYLDPRLSHLEDPLALPGMRGAVAAVSRALAEGAPIAVYGDYDVDGITSAALLVDALRRLGGRVEPFLPLRMEDGYGLSVGALQRCVERLGPRLVVTVDCGTCSSEPVRWARARGVEVVVTDHHEPTGPIAPARAVVNPMLGSGQGASPLAGVGVAFKLVQALEREARERGGKSLDSRVYLDWVALGTICDVVPLRGENRVLTRCGLDRLRSSPRGGLGALMEVAGVAPGTVGSYEVAFLIGPRLNAAGRLGDAQAALELLLTDDAARARRLAEQLDRANRERQRIEGDVLEEAIQRIDEFFDPARDFGLVVAGDGWHPGVVGIVAARLVGRYGRPAVVIGVERGGRARGSCRSVEDFDIVAALEECAEHLSAWGGHSMAAGVELEAAQIPAFAQRFNEVARARLGNRDLRPSLTLDAWVLPEEVNEELFEGVERMRPFGLGNPQPVWGVRGARVAGLPRVVGERHLRLTLQAGGRFWDAIGFGLANRPAPSGTLDVAFQLRRNTFGGRAKLEWKLEDFRESEEKGGRGA